MRKLLTIIVYTLFLLMIGRNLPMLPRFYLFTTPEQQRDDFTNRLKEQTKQMIQKQTGNYSIYFADLNNPYSFGVNQNQTFTAASVNKVPIVAVLYYLDNKGKVNLDEKITLQADDIQAYGTGSLQYQDPGTVYSLQTLAKLALQQSDNTAAYIIAQRIGMPVIQKTIAQWGLKQTDMENNKTSAYDTYLLFKKIYRTEVTGMAKTQELLGFLLDTDIEDRLPALMPNGTIVYHKTGDAIGNLHDVGIIKKGNTVFFLGVLTSDIGDKETATKQVIAKMAKKILDGYEKQDE